jgi:tetratricopeptide (TPR) repeat protein
MRFCHLFKTRRGPALAVVAMLATPVFAAPENPAETPAPLPPPSVAPEPAPQPEAGRETPLTQRKPQRITRKNRAEFLTSLYGQLRSAPDPEAAERLSKAIERVWRQSGSDTADLLMERAGIAIQAKKFDLAIQILSGLTAVAPHFAEGWNQLASVYFLQEDYDKAMRGLRHVLALEPQHYKAIEGLALILREMGDKRGALRATRQALSIYPHLKSAQQQQEELTRDVEGQGI